MLFQVVRTGFPNTRGTHARGRDIIVDGGNHKSYRPNWEGVGHKGLVVKCSGGVSFIPFTYIAITSILFGAWSVGNM